MAFGPPCGTYVSELLLRVRDPRGSNHSRDLARNLLSRVQQIVNAYQRLVLVAEAMPTDPFVQLYQLSAKLPKAIHVIGMSEGGRSLTDAGSFESLTEANRLWFRTVGTRFESFARVGRDLIAVTPGKIDASSVDVNYVKLTEPLLTDETPFDLEEQSLPVVLDIAEAILLLRNREFATFPILMKTISSRLGMEAPVAKS